MTNSDFVFALYRGVLGREPDEEGFALHLKSMEALPPEEVVRVFVDSPERKQYEARR